MVHSSRNVVRSRSRVHTQVVRPHVAQHAGSHRQRLGAARGVLVVPDRAGSAAVTQNEMSQAVTALQLLPAADLALVASRGIAIHLVPTAGLEDGLLGATTVIQDGAGSPWRPTVIRVAVRAGLSGTESVREIVQHEFGHAVSVLRRQDRSEAGAIRYAQRH